MEKEELNVNSKNKKEKCDFILLIMNCMKYKNKALFQKNNWLNNIPPYIKYYHVIGIPTLNKQYTIDETEKILYVSCEDDYCNLPKKVIRSYEAINDIYDFKYIYKTDDDQSLSSVDFLSNLTNILNDRENMIHYGGNIIHIKMPQLSMYNKIHNELPSNIVIKPTKYSNGRFYFLSKQAIVHLIKMKKYIDNEFIEDYAIGFYLDQKLKEYMLNLSTDTYFRDIDNMYDWKIFCKNNIK